MRAFCRLAVVHTPMVALGSVTPVGCWPGDGELVDLHLDGDGVDVDAGGGVDAGGHLAETGVGQTEGVVVLLEGPEVAQVEDGPEVDVEALGPLAGEHLEAVVQLGARPGWPGSRSWGWTAARCCRAGRGCRCRGRGEPCCVDPGDGVGLAAVPARAGEAGDGPGVVEEGVGVGDVAGELELVADVDVAVVVVVDVDGVEDVVPELVEVGAAVGGLRGARSWRSA